MACTALNEHSKAKHLSCCACNDFNRNSYSIWSKPWACSRCVENIHRIQQEPPCVSHQATLAKFACYDMFLEFFRAGIQQVLKHDEYFWLSESNGEIAPQCCQPTSGTPISQIWKLACACNHQKCQEPFWRFNSCYRQDESLQKQTFLSSKSWGFQLCLVWGKGKKANEKGKNPKKAKAHNSTFAFFATLPHHFILMLKCDGSHPSDGINV